MVDHFDRADDRKYLCCFDPSQIVIARHQIGAHASASQGVVAAAEELGPISLSGLIITIAPLLMSLY